MCCLKGQGQGVQSETGSIVPAARPVRFAPGPASPVAPLVHFAPSQVSPAARPVHSAPGPASPVSLLVHFASDPTC